MAHQEIATNLKLEPTDVQSELKVSGITPGELASATIYKTYTCYGINADDVNNQFDSSEFNFETLEEEFTKHCKDYRDEITSAPSKAIAFANKIIFEAGPEIRNEKKSKRNKVLIFIFRYKVIGAVQPSIHTIFVSRFKNIVYKQTHDAKKMILTFKQAGLLATKILVNVNRYVYNQNQTILLTPKCGAIFAKDEVVELAHQLKKEPVDVIAILNSSCCSGGHNLPQSDMSCAVAATLRATENITDKNIRDMIISNVVKQYNTRQKQFNETEFEVYCGHALGGVPSGLDPETLISTFESVQHRHSTLRSRVKAVNEAKIQTKDSGTQTYAARPQSSPKK